MSTGECGGLKVAHVLVLKEQVLRDSSEKQGGNRGVEN